MSMIWTINKCFSLRNILVEHLEVTKLLRIWQKEFCESVAVEKGKKCLMIVSNIRTFGKCKCNENAKKIWICTDFNDDRVWEKNHLSQL